MKFDALLDALLSEAYIRGRRAGLAGLPSSPPSQYLPGSREHAEYMQGWRHGNDRYNYECALWSMA